MKLAAVAAFVGQLLPKANKAITQALLDAGETVQIQLGVARYQNKTNQTKTTIKRGINYVKSLFMCNVFKYSRDSFAQLFPHANVIKPSETSHT